jgi:hypothetical protein
MRLPAGVPVFSRALPPRGDMILEQLKLHVEVAASAKRDNTQANVH